MTRGLQENAPFPVFLVMFEALRAGSGMRRVDLSRCAEGEEEVGRGVNRLRPTAESEARLNTPYVEEERRRMN